MIFPPMSCSPNNRGITMKWATNRKWNISYNLNIAWREITYWWTHSKYCMSALCCICECLSVCTQCKGPTLSCLYQTRQAAEGGGCSSASGNVSWPACQRCHVGIEPSQRNSLSIAEIWHSILDLLQRENEENVCVNLILMWNWRSVFALLPLVAVMPAACMLRALCVFI